MNDSKYIVYYRASTMKQKDGLGLNEQAKAVKEFVLKYGGEIIDEVEEIVSGASKRRAGFDEALGLCKKHGAILLVYRIDRLSRSGFMTLARLDEEGIPFIEAESPHDSDFSKNIKFLLAKNERDTIQKRIKGSIALIKEELKEKGYYITKEGKKITSLGSPQNLTDESRKISKIVRKKKALENPNNRLAYAMAKQIYVPEPKDKRKKNKVAVCGYAKVAKILNHNGFRTSRGCEFSGPQVRNLFLLFEQ